MASQTHQPHFLLVPLMSQSHLIPFTQMAKLLASNGVTITIVLTTLNAARFNTFLNEAKSSNLKIHFLSLPFPCAEAGLPEGCENLDTLPSPELQSMFFYASNMLEEPLEKWLSQQKPWPGCIVSDICLPWTSNLASKFSIPKVVFHGTSCFTLLCSHNIGVSRVHESVSSMIEKFVVPDLPHTIELTKAQLPDVMKQDSKVWKKAMEQFKEGEVSAEGILVNTFEELENLYVRGYEKVVKKIWCIGPLSLHDKPSWENSRIQILSSGPTDNPLQLTFQPSILHTALASCSSVDELDCCWTVQQLERIRVHDSELISFLNTKKPCSIVYVCFGSLSRLHASQLKELALGLEASNHPFIWVIGKNDFSFEIEKWLREDNYELRNKGRGLIIRGWAPQVEILSHPSTGGFLSHCGWNSTLEAVCAGVPIITWPMFAEQFFNEKLIVQVLKIGVRIGVEGVVDEIMEKEKGEKMLVKKEDVKNAIEKLMEKSGEREQRRNRVRELKEMACKAIEDGGSSDSNCKLFIQQIVGQLNN